MKEYSIEEHGKEYLVKTHNLGVTFWFHLDKLHRDYGPAEDWLDDFKVWYQNGQRHRNDGYSASWRDGSEVYHLCDDHKSFYDLLFCEEIERDKK